MRFHEYHLAGEGEAARFLRIIVDDFNRRMNPTFEGHRTTYPGQANIGLSQAFGFGMMYTSPAATTAVLNAELMRTRTRNVGVEHGPHGSVRLSGADEVYYPFKGLVDFIRDI